MPQTLAMIFRFITAACLLLVCVTPASAQRLRVSVEGASFRPLPVAVPAVTVIGGDEKASNDMANRLTKKLRLSVRIVRAFELLPPASYLAPKSEPWTAPKFSRWSNVGASGLLRAGVSRQGDKVRLVIRFFDVVAQNELLAKSYEVAPGEVTDSVHRYLDSLVEKMTDSPGIFQTKIAYVRRTNKGKAIYVCDMDGGRPKAVSDPQQLSLLPEWSQDGSALYFTSYLRNNPDLYRITYPDGEPEWISNKRGLNTGAAMSPDGRQLAMTLSIDGNTEIYVTDPDGKNLKRLTNSWGQDVSPSWSPDGKRLAFVSSRSGNPHIYTMNADGSNQKRLTFQGNYNQEPDWSPVDGGRIVFTARDERLKYDIFLVHPDSGEITRLTQDEGHNESPSFAPDGQHIVFTSTRGKGRSKALYIMDVEGRQQIRISAPTSELETPDWGPRLVAAVESAGK